MENQENLLTKIKFTSDGKVFREFYLLKETFTSVRPINDNCLVKNEGSHIGIVSGPSRKNILILRNDTAKSLHTIWI